MALAEVREVLDTYSIVQAQELLQSKMGEPPLRRLAQQDPNFQEVRIYLQPKSGTIFKTNNLQLWIVTFVRNVVSEHPV